MLDVVDQHTVSECEHDAGLEPIDPDVDLRYLRVDRDWIQVRLHRAPGSSPDLAVLICGPFGFEEMCATRPLRTWAGLLAASGHPCVRVGTPGVGDSSGTPWDPDRVGAGTRAVQVAARWLREVTDARRVVAIGIGLGGLYAYGAAAEEALIDGLVLWASPPRGRELVRQLRAFSRLESSEFFRDIDPPPPLPDGTLQAGGFVLSAETVAALNDLDLSILPAPALDLGVLALSLDGVPATKLVETLRQRGLAVSEADGTGFGAMTADPQYAELPRAAVESVAQWLAQVGEPALDDSPRPALSPAATPEAMSLGLGDDAIERDWSLHTCAGQVTGILSQPLAPSGTGSPPLAAVFFNAGGVSHVGPNRMWVEAARRWCGRGVPSLRLDMPGLGESDGPTVAYPDVRPFYTDLLTDCAREVITALQREGVADRFVLVGLCSGTYWSLHAGLQEPERVAGMMLLNPVVIHWDDGIGATRDLRRVFADRSWRLIRKNATRERVGAVLRLLGSMPVRVVRRTRSSAELSVPARIDATLERVAQTRTRLFAAFSVREGLADDLDRSGWMTRLQMLDNVTIRRIPVNDHTFRPIAIQRLVHREIDEELTRVLEIVKADRSRR